MRVRVRPAATCRCDRPPAPAGPVSQFAPSAAEAAKRETPPFLQILERGLREGIRYGPRPTGCLPNPGTAPGRGRGSCRDQAVLFIACCRLQGVADRFVSGSVTVSGLYSGSGVRSGMGAEIRVEMEMENG